MHRTNILLSAAVFFILAAAAFAQQPDTLWTNFYGGTADDNAASVCQTFDGGFILAGDTREGPGSLGGYAVKVSDLGAQQWSQGYGGASYDYLKYVEQTLDSGYFFTGYSGSYGSRRDAWAIKTDANGDTIWMSVFGGTDSDVCYSGHTTTDGGYIMGCGSYSFGPGSSDIWLIKLDANGDSVWTRFYGSLGSDQVWGIKQASDNGYIVTGTTTSYGTGSYDGYLFKTDSAGDSLWQVLCGAEYSTERGLSVIQTADGGYLAGGYSDDTAHVAGGYDMYVVKTDGNGNIQWQGYYGGADYDYCYEVAQTSDGNYLLCGYTRSYGAGNYDMYLVAVDGQGNQLWTMTFGGADSDYGYGMALTSDGGAILCGKTNSFGAGGYDAYLVRLSGEVLTLTLTPESYQIVIPAGGGSFHFDVQIENLTSQALLVDGWTDLTLPGGYHFPIIIRQNITVPPNATIIRTNINQYIPGGAAPGIYDYNGYVRDHNNWMVLADDSFQFAKLAGDAPPAHNLGWSVFGWFDDEAVSTSPVEFALHQPHPNPFNPETTIDFVLPCDADVELIVHNALGQVVAVLAEGMMSEGSYSLRWNAERFNSGVYFITLRSGSYAAVEKCLLLK